MTAHRSLAAPALLLALLLLGPLAAAPGPADRPVTASLRLSPLLPFHVLHAAHQTLTDVVRRALTTLTGPRTHTHAYARGRCHA